MLNPGILIPYDGTHASIPTGWSRETSLDGKYPKGTANATNPNMTGGSSTHSHSSPSHTHTLQDHYHSGVTSGCGRSPDNTTGDSDAQILESDHYHSYNIAGRSGGTTSGTTVTYGNYSNDPLYYTVIFIKSGGYNFIPNSGLIMSQATSRSGLTYHTASQNRFLKGAGTGANAGSTGGSTTNVHDISHTHTTNTHTHSGTSGTESTQWRKDRRIASPSECVGINHTHTISLSGSAQAINSYSGSLTTTETVQPAFRTLNVYKNDSGSPLLPQPGDIAMWLGTLATIPVGWLLCDGSKGTPDMRDRFLKVTNGSGSSTTGGSNTHTHGSQSHSHTSNGTHTHGGSVSAHTPQDQRVGNGTWIVLAAVNNHTLSTCSSTTANYDAGSTTANSSDNQPEYRTVAYIQMQFSCIGGSFLFNLL